VEHEDLPGATQVAAWLSGDHRRTDARSGDPLAVARARQFQEAYTIVRRLGVRFLLDPYTSKPNVRLYAYTRVGGAVNNFEAVKLLKFSA
jgi:hypothetical protein